MSENKEKNDIIECCVYYKGSFMYDKLEMSDLIRWHGYISLTVVLEL